MSDSWFTTVNDKLEVEPPSIHIPDITLETLVGISVAIAGNVLISLALNIQKLAHLRLGRESKEAMGDSGGESGRSLPGIHRNRSTHDTATACSPGGSREVFQEHLPLETQPLIQPRSSSLPPPARYGLYHNGPSTAGDDTRSGVSTHRGRTRRRQKNSGFSSRFTSLLHLNLGSSSSGPLQESSPTLGSAAMSVGAFLRSKPQVKDTSRGQSEGDNEGDYLRSKLWWLGFILMNLGEVGNFISYAFAPASIVAPLGMFALVANCFFAPLMLKERFRSRDLLGIFLAIVGASTVVLSSPSSDGETPPLTEDELLKAISQRSFVVFSIIYLGLATVLGGLSEGPVGKRIVIVDVGLCAVFGEAHDTQKRLPDARHRWVHSASHKSDIHTFDERVGEDVYPMDYVSDSCGAAINRSAANPVSESCIKAIRFQNRDTRTICAVHFVGSYRICSIVW